MIQYDHRNYGTTPYFFQRKKSDSHLTEKNAGFHSPAFFTLLLQVP